MDKEDHNYLGEDISEALNRFKNSLISGSKDYFDVSEFEGIVDYYLDEGDIDASEIAARQGIQIHPGSIQLKLKFAQVLLNSGKYESAFEYLDQVENIETDNPDIHLMKGSAWLVTGEDENAELSFIRAIKTAGQDKEDILCSIGAAYVQAGETDKAIDYYERVLFINPGNEMALYDLGFLNDQKGDPEKSIDYYNRYLDNDPFNHYIWFNLGICYNKSENFEKAIEAYEYALALKEDFSQSLFNLGNSYANAGKYKEAIEKYSEYCEKDPDNDDSICYIGECYLNMEDYVKAELFYHKAIKLNNNNDIAWFGLGLVMWVNKKLKESILFIKKALRVDSSNSEYWLTLAKVYNDSGLSQKEEEAFLKATRLDPDSREIWLAWVDSCINNGKIDKAIAIMKSAMSTNSDVLLKYRTVGLLLEKSFEKEACELLVSAMKQEFMQIDYLYEVYPEALKNRKVKKLVNIFRKNQ